MEVSELTDEQIANMTPEQIEMLENDPDKLAEILAGQEKGTDEPNDEPEQEEKDDAANGEGEVDEEKEEDEDKPVVLNKSGKGTIPYEKYKELRVENATLRERVQTLQSTQTELETLKTKHESARTPERRAELQKQLNERIVALKEDFPEIGNSLDSVKEIIADISREIEESKTASEAKAKEAEEQRTRTINEQVQEAKENNPHLMHWESNDADAWNEALMQDQILLNTPKWAKKSIEERFVEVVRRVKSVMPEATEPPNATPAEEPKEKAEDTKQKAKAKLEKAVVKKPTTLSDIQGGANPTSESEQLENMSPFELAQKLMKMPDHTARALRAELD